MSAKQSEDWTKENPKQIKRHFVLTSTSVFQGPWKGSTSLCFVRYLLSFRQTYKKEGTERKKEGRGLPPNHKNRYLVTRRTKTCRSVYLKDDLFENGFLVVPGEGGRGGT